jgi:hypothetical protein
VEDGKIPIPIEQKYNDFCTVMKNMLCETWRLFYLLFRRISGVNSLDLTNYESEEDRKKVIKCCELLSLIHEELGVHKWCSCGKGNFFFQFKININNRTSFRINDESIFEI